MAGDRSSQVQQHCLRDTTVIWQVAPLPGSEVQVAVTVSTVSLGQALPVSFFGSVCAVGRIR